ncbi:tRNA dihydrouridine(20/20a) synthase DusA [Spongiibacter pelagi]|uniref:tRNA dihydrouridine(20/20a) synthase DusA n=1 Tax=Spongiibacter pelagi TaxID=2760804 RepID=UPI001CC22A6F|nr:tRNA dihydrouridine(20/20a) synthase DusA [Spongiibacter pelagi]
MKPPSSSPTDSSHRLTNGKAETLLNRRFCAAPMLDWSDRHCRYFWRQLSQHAVLYTEMVTTGALLHGDPERHLNFSAEELPLALQLGGSNPAELAHAAKMAENWHYSEVNLNCGCPSDRVQNGFFGACLMSRPELVADCVKAMKDACDIPVTVKHRIGIDDQEGYEPLRDFVGQIQAAGCDAIIVHARKAWLQGLSPKENREIPPLNYPMVYQLKRDFPELELIINGGINTLDEAEAHLSHVDGIMLGRSVYQNPWLLAEVDARFYGEPQKNLDPLSVARQMGDYIEQQLQSGARLHHITRHMLGLFNGMPGARQFRRHLSQQAFKPESGMEVLEAALTMVESAIAHNEERASQLAQREQN